MRRSRVWLAGSVAAFALVASGCTSTVDNPSASVVGSDTGSTTAGSTTGSAREATAEPDTSTEVELGPDIRILTSGVVQVGAAGAPVAIEVYEDFLCPACASFDAAYGAQIDDEVAAGRLRVSFHDLNFLNRASASGDYSTRAAAAARCVAQDGDAADYLAFRGALFAPGGQPAEGGSDDPSNADLAALAVQTGASPAAATCIETGARVDEAAAQAEWSTNHLSSKSGGQVSTPSVYDGATKVDPSKSDWVATLTG